MRGPCNCSSEGSSGQCLGDKHLPINLYCVRGSADGDFGPGDTKAARGGWFTMKELDDAADLRDAFPIPTPEPSKTNAEIISPASNPTIDKQDT